MSTTLFPLQYLRQNADPIDVDSVFNTTAERLAYLSNGRRYPGQIVADLQDGSVYVLDPTGSAWVELGGNAAGLNSQVQYNNAGEFGADAEFTYNAITSTVGLRNIANATTSVNVLVGTTTADAWATTYTDTVPPPVPFDLACGLTQTIAANPSDGYTLSNLGPPDPPETKYTIDNGYIIYTVNGYGSGALGDGSAGSSGYGLRFDPTGQSNYGPDDYIQPGDPWEGFGLQVNGVTIATGSNSSRPTTESWNTWNAGDNLIVAKPDLDPATQGVFVVQYQTVGNEPVIRIKMSYTNSTTAPVSVKMIRGIDPDIDQFQYNEFDTLNWRGLGTISGNDITYAAGTYSEKPLAIYAPGNGYTHNTGIVSGWPTYSFDYVLGGPEDGGNGSYFDYAICAAWDCGVVAPGETATVCVYYICSQTESEILGYITGSAPVQYTPDFDTGAVAIDSSGASYCAGVDSYTGNIFITKFNSTGTLVWQKSLAGIGGKYCNTIKIDSAGNIYVAVNYDTIPGTIVLKINTSLTIEWQTDILDGTNRIAIQNMQLDNSGNLWILASDPDNEAYAHLLKLDSSGTILWQKVISDAGFNVVAQDLVLTPTGATVLINSFSVGVYKPTLLNYSSTGTLIDQITVVDPSAILFTNRNNLAVDSTGATYILQRWATTQNYAILTKIVLGAIEWQKKVVIPNGSDLRSSGVHIDQSDNVYISLARDDFADNISALYILKFSSVGTLIWSNGFTATNGVYYNFEGYKNNIAVGSNYFTVVGYIGAAGGGYLSLAVHMPLDGNGWGSNDGFSYGPIDALISTPSVFTVSTGTMSDSTASLTGGTIVLTIDTLANSRNLVVFSGKSDWNFNPDGSTSLPNYTLPANDGLDGQILTTDGSGILTWVPKEIDPATPVGRGSIFGYTTANSNVHIGYCSGNIAQTGNDNIAIGYQSLQCNTYGDGNTAIGCRAMQQNMYGTCNTAVGNFSLKCNCNGSYNVAVGDCALLKNLAGNYNTALGKGSLQGIIGTGYNVGVGFEAGRCVTTGGNNTIIGSLSGCGGLSNTVLIGSGTCERIKVDGTGLYINGLPFTGASSATPTTLGTVYAYTSCTLWPANIYLGYCAGNTNTCPGGAGNIGIGSGALLANTSGLGNVAIGALALPNNTWGCNNIALGYQALNRNTTGFFNIAIGYNTLSCNTYGCGNVAIGNAALQFSSCGNANTAIGDCALCTSICSTYNVAVGTAALANSTCGNYNTVVGTYAGWYNTTGCGNVSFGNAALSTNSTGHYNTALGTEALYWNYCSNNVAVGFRAMRDAYCGANNIAIGNCALRTTCGSNNIAIGISAGYGISTGQSNTVIGGLAAFNCSCTVLIGAGSLERIRVDGTGLYINGACWCSGGSVAAATPTSRGTVFGYTTSISNVAFGCCAGNPGAQPGCNNIAIGCCTLASNTTGAHNFAAGFMSLANNITGCANFAQGYQALHSNTGGSNNFAVGCRAMLCNTTGCHNFAVGQCALAFNAFGSGNIGIGNNVLRDNCCGCNNIALGAGTLTFNKASSNIAIGFSVLFNNTTGTNNIGIGSNALCCNTNGYNNIAIGPSALLFHTSGTRNIAIGADALLVMQTGQDNLAIGAGALAFARCNTTNLAIGNGSSCCNYYGTRNSSIGYRSQFCNVCGNDNTSLGYKSLHYMRTGSNNIAIGTCALYGTYGGFPGSIACHSNNIAIGTWSMQCMRTGISNIAIGTCTLRCNDTGAGNIVIGLMAAENNITGFCNIAIGLCTLRCGTAAANNISIGNYAMECSTSPANSSNIAIGSFSMYLSACGGNVGIGNGTLYTNSGSSNIALGPNVLCSNTSGSGNIGVGLLSLVGNTSGFHNVGIGSNSLRNNSTGSYNIAIGEGTMYGGVGAAAYQYNCNIGIGNSALRNIWNGARNIGLGTCTLWNITCGNDNIAQGYLSQKCARTGLNNISIGSYSQELNQSGCNNISLGSCSLRNNIASNNIAIGDCAGCLITTGANNTVIGNLPAANGCVCTLLIAAGTCERIRVDNTGLYVNGSTFSIAAATPTSLGTVFGYTSSGNTFIGCCMGNATSAGNNNFGLGRCSMENLANGGGNIGVGETVLRNLTTGCNNIGIGGGNLYCLTTGCNNIAIGCGALYNNINAISNNTAIGFQAQGNARGGCNVVIGACALTGRAPAYGQSYGCANVALGAYAMFCTITASCNVAIGCGSLYSNTAGCGNVAVGHASLCANTVGVCNISIGLGSMVSNTTGASNISIGACAGCSITTGAGNTIIGSLPGSAGLTCTLLIGAGTCERLRIDNTCICVNGSTLYTLLTGNGLCNTAVGFRIVPQNIQCADYTIVAADSAGHVLHPAVDTNPRTFTIPSNATVAFPVGTSITIVNESFYPVTIAITSDTLYLAGSTTVGSRTLGQNGVATILKIQNTVWLISGSGLT